MTLAAGIIADDYTGAVMVAGYLEAAGIEAPVLFDAGHLDEAGGAPVVVLASRSRLSPADEATAEVTRLAGALDRAGCTQVIYKACASFDSTDDGNIGPVADLLADRYQQRPLVMNAGFPRFNTTVHQGYLFYRGRLVTESIKRFDPVTPMPDPDLVRFLSRQTTRKIALLPHPVLLGGVERATAMLAALAEEGAAYVLTDCSDDDDAVTAAALAAGHRAALGSDTFVIRLAQDRAARPPRDPAPSPRHVGGPAAVLVGSVGPVVAAQLARFADSHPVHTLNIVDPRPEPALIAEALDWAGARIGSGPTAVATAGDTGSVEAAQRIFGVLGAARRAERLLAGIATGLRERGVRRLVVAGGETSGAVVDALRIGWVRALPDGPHGTGFCVAQAPTPMSLYLKAGKLGGDDILLAALAAMEPGPDR